jgi:hypothetical protein
MHRRRPGPCAERSPAIAPVAYSGEVWTDARGFATVVLPHPAGGLPDSLQYELRPSPRGVTATIAAGSVDGHFTIETDEPHVKVVWRVRSRRPQPRGKEQS